MLSGIFQKRKKIQELRAPSLQDIKKFRDMYTRHAENRHVEAPPCFEKSIYKAISCQKELHSVDFRQEDVTDPQIIALAETLLEMSMISSLDLRDNRITDDGAKALLEVLRLQVINAKSLPKTDSKTKKTMAPLPVPDYARYITNITLKGNEISPALMEEMAQYTEILKREDKRLEVRAALNQIDRNSSGGVEEDDFKAVIKLLTGSEPGKKEVKQLLGQITVGGDSTQNALALENVLLAKCATSPSKKGPSPPWEALVQIRHYNFAPYPSTSMASSPQPQQPAKVIQPLDDGTKSPTRDVVTIQPSATSNSGTQRVQIAPNSSIMIASSPVQAPPPPAPISQPRSITVGPTSPTVTASPATPQPRPIMAGPTSPIAPSSPVMSQPRAITLGPKSSTVTTSPAGSPTKQVDFRPPASPPPPFSLTTQVSSNSLLTPGSPKSPVNYVEESSTSLSPSADTSPAKARVPVVSPERPAATRVNVASLDKGVVQAAPTPVTASRTMDDRKQVVVTPSVTRPTAMQDDLGIDLSTLNDEDDVEFTDDEDDGSHQESGGARVETGSVADEEDSRKSVRSMASTLSSTRYGATNSSNLRLPVSDSNESLNGDIMDMSDGESVSGTRNSVQRPNGRTTDLSSLVYNEMEETNWLQMNSPASPQLTTSRQQDYNVNMEDLVEEEVEDIREECVVLDLMRETKPRNIAKLVHPRLKTDMTLQDFPGDVPYRNLVSLVLSNTGLRNLTLFGEMRFPCMLVLDLSHNRIERLCDSDLAGFSKLQVINLAHNRIKTINGLGKLTEVKALNLSHNSIKVVINIENLVRLQILKLNNNMIGVVSSLRLLSLNKMLQNLDLDGNPLVETDDRQRRKVTVHILNIIPTLRSMGSVPLIGHNSKEKKKCVVAETAPIGKSLLDFEELPDLKSTWIGLACDILQMYQDPEVEVNMAEEEDLYGDLNGSMAMSPTKRDAKRLGREAQRKRDELRSKALGYRSRDKAPPSPPRVKTSPYVFGPPTTPPVKSPRKANVNPALAQKQLRRASELSAPKHPPVDQTLMKQEFRRKSRPTFELNMSVAERVLLAQEKASRRPTLTIQPAVHRPSQTGIYPPNRNSVVDPAPTSPTRAPEPDTVRPVSPRQGETSPQRSQGVVEFRIEPLLDNGLPSPRSILRHPGQPGASPVERKPVVKESLFLQSLAVSDFLNHVEEEFSTALTALTVLLSMSERESSDLNKLKDYRNSLIALDILNESESRALYQKARTHDDPVKVEECTKAFDRIGIVKKCIKNLLDKLNTHAPGSTVTRAFCHSLRTTELKGIIPAITVEDDSTTRESTPQSIASMDTSALSKQTTKESQPHEAPTSSTSSTPSSSLHSRLFQDSRMQETSNYVAAPISRVDEDEKPKVDSEVDEFDFLSDDQPLFEEEEIKSSPAVALVSSKQVEAEAAVEDEPLAAFLLEEEDSKEPTPVSSTSSHSPSYVANSDTTMDIQEEDWDCQPTEVQPQNLERDEEDEELWAPVERSDSSTPLEDEADTLSTSEPPKYEQPAPTSAADEDGIDASFLDDNGNVFDMSDPDEAQADVAQTSVTENDQQDEMEEREHNDENEADEVEDEPPYVEEEAQEEAAAIEMEQGEGEDAYEETSDELTLKAVQQVEVEEEEEDQDDEEVEMFGDWEKGFDPSTNHYFWFNHDTGESQWTPPEGWPYEVDVPFEEDAQDEEEGEEAEETTTVPLSTTDVNEDMFSDQDLPDF